MADSTFVERWLLPALLFWPLLGAVLVRLLGQSHPTVETTEDVPVDALSSGGIDARRLTLGVLLVETALGLTAWLHFNVGQAGWQLRAELPWLPELGAGISLGVDGLALPMLVLTTLLMPLALVATWNQVTTKLPTYGALLLVLTSGIVGVFTALDLLLFYLAWELMLIPMYFIIGMGSSREKPRGAQVRDAHHVRLAAHARGRGGIVRGRGQSVVPPRRPAAGTAWPVCAAVHVHRVLPCVCHQVRAGPFPHMVAGCAVRGAGVRRGGARAQGGDLRAAALRHAALSGGCPAGVRTERGAGIGRAGDHLGRSGGHCAARPAQGALLLQHQPSGFHHAGVLCAHPAKRGRCRAHHGESRHHHQRAVSAGGLPARAGGHGRVECLWWTGPRDAAVRCHADPLHVQHHWTTGTNGFIGEFLVLLGAYRTHPVLATIATSGVVFASVYALRAVQMLLFTPLDVERNARMRDLQGRELVVMGVFAVAMLWIGLAPRPLLDRVSPASAALIERVQGDGRPQ